MFRQVWFIFNMWNTLQKCINFLCLINGMNQNLIIIGMNCYVPPHSLSISCGTSLALYSLLLLCTRHKTSLPNCRNFWQCNGFFEIFALFCTVYTFSLHHLRHITSIFCSNKWLIWRTYCNLFCWYLFVYNKKDDRCKG